MDNELIKIISTPIPLTELKDLAALRFGDMIKVVVDIKKGVMAVGGELHADEEACLIEQGSAQFDLWGINIYVNESWPQAVEFDSMINVRPSQNNRSRDVEDQIIRQKIITIVNSLILI